MRRFTVSVLTFLVLLSFSVTPAYAQLTILPSTDTSDEDCVNLLQDYEVDPEDVTKLYKEFGMDVRNELLACAIKTGRVSLVMIPFFISYFSNFLLALSGIIAVLFIVLGGYFYIYGGLTDEKEKGKKYIFNALLGMSVALLAWVIVTIIIAAVTG